MARVYHAVVAEETRSDNWPLSEGEPSPTFEARPSPFVVSPGVASNAGPRRKISVLITCWSVKGGSGTTVVASALSLLLARRDRNEVVLADVGGDAPAVLGLPEPNGPGLFDWLATPGVEDNALRRLEFDAAPGLRLLPKGSPGPTGGEPSASAERILRALSGERTVVVDAGPPSALADELAAGASVSLLVLRPCYLALRRALAAPVRPSAVILVEERKRALDVLDVEGVLGVPVQAVVPWDPAIARCVDAGLLGARLPTSLASALRAAA